MIYRIDMSADVITQEAVPDAWSELGGRALTSAIIASKVPPRSPALGPENKLVFAPGLLAGTIASSSGRLSVGAKSPLTGGIKESNTGGPAGALLARLGIRALIIEGKAHSDEWGVLEISQSHCVLHAAHEMGGLCAYDTVNRLRKRFGDKVCVITIGPAGEQCLSAAAVCLTDTDGIPARHAARGGLGAVMGSKRLKAIVIDGKGSSAVDLDDKSLFRETVRRYHEALREHPTTGQSMPTLGTSALVSLINKLGGLPTRNFSSGTFEKADQISGESLRDLILSRKGKTTHPCMPGCMIQCSNTVPSPDGEEQTRGFEYESIVLLGANCGIGDLDVIARMNRLCDEIGVDTMEVGDALAVAMEAGLADFGDGNRALELIKEIGKGSPLGRILGNGAVITGKVLGVDRVPAVKGQGMSAYDPRVFKGTGVTYATSPMGADHTAGNALPGSVLPGVGAPDHAGREHQVELSRYLQHLAVVFDALGFCWFSRGPLLNDKSLLLDMLQGRWGRPFSMETLLKMAGDTLDRELEFNRKAGLGEGVDRLPEFFYQEKLPPRQALFDLSEEEMQFTLQACVPSCG